MAVPFADFLEAKFDLDERSLNRDVREAFWQVLQDLPKIDCLDLGAGTGATARRLLSGRLANRRSEKAVVPGPGLIAPLSLTVLDRDPVLLDRARQDAVGRLRALGLEPRSEAGAIFVDADRAATSVGANDERPVSIRFVTAELEAYRPEQRCNVITANALLDIVPLAKTLQLLTGWLQPGGHLYASINYDGDTTLLPQYDDAAFEARVLSHYNDTMERRRVGGLATGGARCGRRLHALLPDFGFDILAFGSSDWNIAPLLGQYRDADAVCLQLMMEIIGAEALESGLFDAGRLARWRDDRMRLLRERRLGLIVHQLDLLARYEP